MLFIKLYFITKNNISSIKKSRARSLVRARECVAIYKIAGMSAEYVEYAIPAAATISTMYSMVSTTQTITPINAPFPQERARRGRVSFQIR